MEQLRFAPLTDPDELSRPAPYRYGAVLLLSLVLLLFEVVAPDTTWSRAVAFGLTAAALMIAVVTSRSGRALPSPGRAVAVALFGLVGVVGIATGLFSIAVSSALTMILLAAIPVALVSGLVRLVRDAGVTIQAVAGALAIYLLVGLLFAAAIGFVSQVANAPYFSQPGTVNTGDRIYFSFTVLTTTGFGDYTAALPVGHALAVLEMLTGQLYLVTVIGILVGNFAGRRRAD